MDHVASSYRQRRVHVILDNLNTYPDTNQEDFVSQWNRRHAGRFRFHYTPTHGSMAESDRTLVRHRQPRRFAVW